MPVKKNAPPALDPVFAAMLKKAGLPLPVREYRFDTRPADKTARPKLPRAWAFDYAWLPVDCIPNEYEPMVALEVEGGAWVGGRHTSGSGFTADMEKYSEAAAQGWRIIRVPPAKLCTPATIDLIRRALEAA